MSTPPTLLANTHRDRFLQCGILPMFGKTAWSLLPSQQFQIPCHSFRQNCETPGMYSVGRKRYATQHQLLDGWSSMELHLLYLVGSFWSAATVKQVVQHRQPAGGVFNRWLLCPFLELHLMEVYHSYFNCSVMRSLWKLLCIVYETSVCLDIVGNDCCKFTAESNSESLKL